MSKLWYSTNLRTNSKATCLLLLWHPAYRQRELNTGVYVERENLSSRCEEKTSSGDTAKRKVSMRGTGAETLVVVMIAIERWKERRGVVIWFLIMDEN